ncbi:MAG: peptidoglycan-binding protein [Actinobacteria bacterium]|nr:peptidoglycan-binding protein [Actinomycetota bacterium]
MYCSNTSLAVEQFQQLRGLPSTGVCDHVTWSVLVESSWVLGSRLLYLTSPHMRGDDVRSMQTVLAKLGFDCGRADGIFGPNTLRALTEFQQNYGITADGICGVNTIRALERTRSQSGEGPGIVTVREYETLLASAEKSGRPRIVVEDFVRRSSGLAPLETRGMQLPVLRETRMPAVMCSVGPDLDHAAAVGLAGPLSDAIIQWCERPIG